MMSSMRRSMTFLCCLAAIWMALATHGGPVAPEYIEGEALVIFKPAVTLDSALQTLNNHSATLIRHFDYLSTRRRREMGLVRANGRTTAELVDELKNEPSVETAEPNYVRRLMGVPPDDFHFPELWALQNTGQMVNGEEGVPGADVKFIEAWSLARSFTNEFVVAVIDSGVDYTHPDLAANIWTNPGEIPGNGVDDDLDGRPDDIHGWDFVNEVFDPIDSGYHGTHVAGTIAAIGNNQIGVVGINPRVKIMALKASNDGFNLPDGAIIEAIQYATLMKLQGVNIVAINASFGGSGFDTAMMDAIQEAGIAGIVFCAAAGNDGSDNDVFPVYPASYLLTNMIVVAASDQNDTLATFSNYGTNSVDLAAPGENIFSLLPMAQANVVTFVQTATTTYEGIPLTYSGMTAGITGAIYDCGLGYDTNFPAEVSNNIALISRGDLFFNEKVGNAMAAGARAAIIYNFSPGNFNGTLGYGSNWIPAVAISQFDGLDLLATLPATGTVANFGSEPFAYQFLDGTSMATPQVVGAVAFAAMNFPDETVSQRINRVLANVDLIESLTNSVRTGGRLNLQRIVDTDANQLPDWWEQTYFGQLTGTSPGADSDQDGASNLAEWLAGTIPTNAASVLRLTAHIGSSNSVVVSWPSVEGKHYQLERATNLATGFDFVVATNIAATPPMNTRIEPMGPPGNARFYRIQLEQ